MAKATTNLERIARIEVNMDNVSERLSKIETGVDTLNGKFDQLTQHIGKNYVTKGEHEEAKKNKRLEIILTVMVTSVITGLIAFFLREAGV